MKRAALISDLLAQLGSTPDAVAAALALANIRGVRNTVRQLNPLVRFLQDQLRIDEYLLDIWTADGSHYVLRMQFDSTSKEIQLPPAVKDFLDAFNRGAYPQLELSADAPP